MGLSGWIKRHRWDLAIVDENWHFSFIESPYKDRWFADPFILSVSDKEIVLLVEEFTYSIGRGRIARLAIDRNLLFISEMQIVLDLNTHLSFPSIVREGGRVFIIPENSASGNSTIYEYDDSSRKADPISVICDYPLTDATLHSEGDSAFLFSTFIPDPNGKTLTIFKKDGTGKYQPVQSVMFDDYVARNAGALLETAGGLIRPAQICDGGFGYGLGLEFQRVTYKDGQFSFEALERRFPPKGYDGMHTYNTFGEIAVVDCRRFLRPLLRNTLHAIKELFAK